MYTTTLHIPNSRLAEGSYYHFSILKVVALDPGESYFVMRDPLGYKILMPAKYYTAYGFEPGQTIECRVDKVNCNGRMFLEPLHPYYREGQVYTFEVVSSGSSKNMLDQTTSFFIVKDVLGQTWKVISHTNQSIDTNPSHVNCYLHRIKKGKPTLQLAGEPRHDHKWVDGETYQFTLVDERINPEDGNSYYILEDESGERQLLRKKYYIHYGFRKGDTIRCRVVNKQDGGPVHLEPQHPCYQIGKEAVFPLKRLEKLVFSDGSHQMVLVFSDCYDEDIKVHVDDGVAKGFEHVEQVRAKVLDIYKSRLEIDISPHSSINGQNHL